MDQRVVSQASAAVLTSGGSPGRSTDADVAPGMVGAGKDPVATTSPPMAASQSTVSHARSRTSGFAVIVSRSVPACHASVTGAASARCSQSAGFGVRSGQTRPSVQKSPSFGSSPKSPP